MNREEYERLKEAEKEHLRKVRDLKSQLQEARRRQSLSEALSQLDTSALDDEFEASLRRVQESNLTAEARFEMAMDAVESAEERERQRLEIERFEADQEREAAADLVRQMKAEMRDERDEMRGTSSQASPPDSAPRQDETPSAVPKTIGRPRPRTE